MFSGLNPNTDTNIWTIKQIMSCSNETQIVFSAKETTFENNVRWRVHSRACNKCLLCLLVFHNLFKDAWDRVLKWTKGQTWINSWFSAALGLMRGIIFFPAAKDTYHSLLVQPRVCLRLSNKPSMCNSIKEHFRQTGLLELTSWENSTWTGSNTHHTEWGALAFVRFVRSRSSLPGVWSRVGLKSAIKNARLFISSVLAWFCDLVQE